MEGEEEEERGGEKGRRKRKGKALPMGLPGEQTQMEVSMQESSYS